MSFKVTINLSLLAGALIALGLIAIAELYPDSIIAGLIQGTALNWLIFGLFSGLFIFLLILKLNKSRFKITLLGRWKNKRNLI